MGLLFLLTYEVCLKFKRDVLLFTHAGMTHGPLPLFKVVSIHKKVVQNVGRSNMFSLPVFLDVQDVVFKKPYEVPIG